MMKCGLRIGRGILLIGLWLSTALASFAEETKGSSLSPPHEADSASLSRVVNKKRWMHRLGAEVRPSYLLPTHRFFKGENGTGKPIETALSAHLRYSFAFAPGGNVDRIYGGPYQGVGVAWFTFGEPRQLGNPLAFYLFQGARIASLNSRLSLNYEWNFGLSSGWKPFDEHNNPSNKVMGSELNAYLNLNFYLNWKLSERVDLTTGVDIAHFSNGNTKFPNCGLNTAGLKLGVVYRLTPAPRLAPGLLEPLSIPSFRRHISYDLVLFGSWRRKGVLLGDEQIASPEAYTVLGFNFTPMYNLGHKVRVGASLDGVYDGSSGVFTEDVVVHPTQPFYKPPFDRQIALGLSARAEYVMPYFSVNFGVGKNVVYRGSDFNGWYQVLALKIEVTRSSFIHIGYNLRNFHLPNYLMLGIGYRFNNKYPTFHR